MSVGFPRTGRRQPTPWACCTALLAAIAGCERGDREALTPAFVPSWAEARLSLESSLSAWCDGPFPLPESFDIPGVQFVDSQASLSSGYCFFRFLVGRTSKTPANLRSGSIWRVRSRRNSSNTISSAGTRLGLCLDDYEKFAHWEHA